MARRARDPWSLLAAATAFLLPVAYSPSVYATFWTPKAAVLLVAGAVGLTRLPALLRAGHRRVALAAIAFLGIATLATVVSPDPTAALVGRYNTGTGLVFIASLVGVWALGMTAGDRDLVRRALLAGLGASCAVAVLQSVVDLGLPALDPGARASGLAGNAVHLGTTAALGIALLARDRHGAALAGIVLFGAAAQLSGTRLALVVIAVVVIATCARDGIARLVTVSAAVVVAVVLGTVIGDVRGAATATARTEDRALDAAGGGARVRLDTWAYARHAVLDRPLVGHGPGRFLAATVGDRTRSIARAEGVEAVYADAHNLAVEHAVTTGLLGLAALAAWLAGAFAAARGPLAAGAAAVLLMSLGQPQSVGTTPLLVFALGTAAPRPTAGGVRGRVAPVAAAVVGLVAAATLLVGDARLLSARNDLDVDVAEQADQLLRPWPEPASIVARAERFRSLDLGVGDAQLEARAASRRWLRVALGRDRADPSRWMDLADAEAADGLVERATAHYEEALDRDRWAARAMIGLGRIALAGGDEATARRWFERALDIEELPDLRRQLRRIDG